MWLQQSFYPYIYLVKNMPSLPKVGW